MNLLSILLKALLGKSTLTALAKKTGLNSAQLKKLIPLALPLLLQLFSSKVLLKIAVFELLVREAMLQNGFECIGIAVCKGVSVAVETIGILRNVADDHARVIADGFQQTHRHPLNVARQNVDEAVG